MLQSCPMANIQSIVAELKQERDRLSQAIDALESVSGTRTAAGRKSTDGKRKVSALARRRMAQAQRARWRKVKSQTKPATPKLTLVKRTMSASARRKIAAAQCARRSDRFTREHRRPPRSARTTLSTATDTKELATAAFPGRG